MKNVPQKAIRIRKSIVRKLQTSISHTDTKFNLGALLKQYRTNLRLHFQNYRNKLLQNPTFISSRNSWLTRNSRTLLPDEGHLRQTRVSLKAHSWMLECPPCSATICTCYAYPILYQRLGQDNEKVTERKKEEGRGGKEVKSLFIGNLKNIQGKNIRKQLRLKS